MYNPEMNTLDIRSNGLYPSNVLSNLCSNGFRFDGMVCGSMEGFLQSLKRQDLDKQRQICSMKGGNGCGGIMRIAPIPLFAAVNKRMSITDAMKLAASASEITHQHPLGFLPSALESYIIYII